MIRARTGHAKPSTKTDSAPIAVKIRLAAVAFKADGKDDYAAGLAHAADMVDAESHLLTGGPFVDALDRMLEARLEAFVGDVAAAVRDARGEEAPPPPVDLPPPAIGPKPRRHRGAPLVTETPRLVGKPAPVIASSPRSYEPRSDADRSENQARGVRRVLAAVAQHMPGGVDREQLSILTGYKRSTRNEYVGRGLRAGWLRLSGSQIFATDAGERELGPSAERLPTGDALLRHWLATLPEGERRVLAFVAPFYPHPVNRERIGEATGYKRSTRNEYVSRLARRHLLESSGTNHVVAAGALFDPPEERAVASGRGTRS